MLISGAVLRREDARRQRCNAAFLSLTVGFLGWSFCSSSFSATLMCQLAASGSSGRKFDDAVRPMHVMSNNYVRIMDAGQLLQELDNPEKLLFSSECGEIQRNLDSEHLDDLIQFQVDFKEANGEYFFPNPIFVAKYKDKLAVLDGQHRLQAMRYFLATPANGPIRVLVSIINMHSGTAEEYDGLFTALNKNKPVKLYKNVRDYKEVLKLLESYFERKYSRYLRTTETPQRPNMNLEKLMAFMDDNDVVSRLGLSYEQLINEIEDLNNVYRLHWRVLIQSKGYIPNIDKHIQNCVNRDPQNQLFLGLYRNFEWLKRIDLKVHSESSYLSMNHVPDTFRPKISRKLRREVWEKRARNASMVGECYVCGGSLDYDSFVCGHVISVAKGGETTLSNLEPVCHMCNSEMGTDNLEEFREEMKRSLDS